MSNELSHITESSFVNDIKKIVEQGRSAAYGAVNAVMIETYWHIGKRIVQQEQNGNQRAEYGKGLIEILSKELTIAYGKGFSKRNLQYFRAFYLTYSDIQIVQSRLHNLTWTHILTTLRVENPVAARWYLQTASQEMWSVRTLDRNISTQYFERHFKQPQILENAENKSVPDKNLFAAKYMPLMPTEEKLRREIEQQKMLFQLQHNELNTNNIYSIK